ncbi:MAG TPA: rhomboid family intramembrane serine protease [Opitutaceae bacterium]
MGEPYWLVAADGGYHLLVETHAAGAVREQLACFDRESAGWPSRTLSPVSSDELRETEFFTPLLWLLAILAVFRAQVEWPALTDAGLLDVRGIFDRGEWWRIGTALFLHADAGHLVSNGMSGLLVFPAVLSTFGRRLGWLLLAVAALAGNLAVAAMYYPANYHSLGASTAIFAGFGLLTGRAVPRAGRSDGRRPWRVIFVRLAAGLTILSLYGAGAGTSRVDVLAHLSGFGAGLVLGLAAPRRPGR